MEIHNWLSQQWTKNTVSATKNKNIAVNLAVTFSPRYEFRDSEYARIKTYGRWFSSPLPPPPLLPLLLRFGSRLKSPSMLWQHHGRLTENDGRHARKTSYLRNSRRLQRTAKTRYRSVSGPRAVAEMTTAYAQWWRRRCNETVPVGTVQRSYAMSKAFLFLEWIDRKRYYLMWYCVLPPVIVWLHAPNLDEPSIRALRRLPITRDSLGAQGLRRYQTIETSRIHCVLTTCTWTSPRLD